MTAVVNFPPSMNLGVTKPACVPNCEGSFLRIRSDNSTYGALDTIRIEIPCGRDGVWLHPQDSFLEFKAKLTYTDGSGGAVSLDGNAYSYFSNCRLYHG